MTATKPCRACDGRGYFRCGCWPGDCLCGGDLDACFECEGAGIDAPEYEDYDYQDGDDEDRQEGRHK